LRRSVAATVGRLTGTFESDEPPTSGGPGDDTIAAVVEVRTQMEERA